MDLLKEIIKYLVAGAVYFGVGPALGLMLKNREKLQTWAIAFMAFWLVRPPTDFTLMIHSIEKYRGHTKGFEINFMDAIAIGLALAAILEKGRKVHWFPPGLWAWILWVMVSTLSVFNAVEPLYALMPAVKFGKMALVFFGIYAGLKSPRQVHAMMRAFAVALCVQVLVCLWARYIGGGYRAKGWFEHSNPMAMWSYMLGLPLFGLALTSEIRPRDALLYFAGFGAAGLAIVLSVSRASLAAFVAGSVIVFFVSCLQGLNRRRVVVGVSGAIAGTVVLLFSIDTFMERMKEGTDPKDDLRLVLNVQSEAMLKDYPLIGIGWNQFGIMNSRPVGVKYSRILEDWEAARGRMIYVEQYQANPLTESLYWLLLAENGVLGFATFVIFMVVTLWHGLKGTWIHWKSPLGLMLLGITVAFFITYTQGKVERVLTQTKNLTTWIMLCAVLSRSLYWPRSAVAASWRGSRQRNAKRLTPTAGKVRPLVGRRGAHGALEDQLDGR